jgi:hypothetical protein
MKDFILCPNLINCGHATSPAAVERELALIPRSQRRSVLDRKYGEYDSSNIRGADKSWYTPPPTRRRLGNTNIKDRFRRAVK